MKFGMNLLLWTGDLDDSIMPTLETLKNMGYDGVELPLFNADVDHWAAWGKKLDELELERTGHKLQLTLRGAIERNIFEDADLGAGADGGVFGTWRARRPSARAPSCR